MQGLGKEDEKKILKGTSSGLVGKPFIFYIKLIRWIILGVFILEAVLLVIDLKFVYLWFINLLLFIFLAIWGQRVYGLSLAQTIILGSIAGLILGFLVALFKLIWFHKLYLFFNLITEPITILLAGLLISGATYLILTKEYKQKDKASILGMFKKKNSENRNKKNNDQIK